MKLLCLRVSTFKVVFIGSFAALQTSLQASKYPVTSLCESAFRNSAVFPYVSRNKLNVTVEVFFTFTRNLLFILCQFLFITPDLGKLKEFIRRIWCSTRMWWSTVGRAADGSFEQRPLCEYVNVGNHLSRSSSCARNLVIK